MFIAEAPRVDQVSPQLVGVVLRCRQGGGEVVDQRVYQIVGRSDAHRRSRFSRTRRAQLRRQVLAGLADVQASSGGRQVGRGEQRMCCIQQIRRGARHQTPCCPGLRALRLFIRQTLEDQYGEGDTETSARQPGGEVREKGAL